MKNTFFGVFAVTVIAFTACNSGGNKEKESHDMDNMNKDTTHQAVITDDKDIKTVAITLEM